MDTLYELLPADSALKPRNESVSWRAKGLLFGQIAGDSLGSLVEFMDAAQIRRDYPLGVREMKSGGAWGLLAGQPTDDSELALVLARSLIAAGGFEREVVARGYAWWFASGPFDIGLNTRNTLGPAWHALRQGESAAQAAQKAARIRAASAANGALMRISPLAIYGHALPDAELAQLAREDAGLTHANPLCLDANAVYCVALAKALRGASSAAIYEQALTFAHENAVAPEILAALGAAPKSPPTDYYVHMGWVLIAFQNAFFQLLNAPNAEEGVVDTIARGGDTDTNACIAGALLGAAYGADAWPASWKAAILACRPETSRQGVLRPRPRCLWPVDLLQLSDRLVLLGEKVG